MNRSNIILIGFMGSGKTTVGRIIAKKLGYDFLDTDQEIEKKEQCTISELFDQKGENYFREQETCFLKEIMDVDKKVISTGGGLPIKEENAVLLKQAGFVVFLQVSKKTVLERLSGDTARPLLKGEDPESRVEVLLKQRQEKYQIASHIAVVTDGKEQEKLAEEIIGFYQNERKLHEWEKAARKQYL